MDRIPLTYFTEMIPEHHGPASLVAAFVNTLQHDPKSAEIDRDIKGPDFGIRCYLPEYTGMQLVRHLEKFGFEVFPFYGPERDGRGARWMTGLRIQGAKTALEAGDLAVAFHELAHHFHGQQRQNFWNHLQASGRQFVNPMTGDWLDTDMVARLFARENAQADAVLRANRQWARGSEYRTPISEQVRRARSGKTEIGKF